MWNNYFYQIQKKYSMRISTKTPLVVRFDGKNVTKNKRHDLIDTSKDSFLDSLEKTVKYFTKKYHCYGIFGADEANFIFPDPMIIIENLSLDKHHHSDKIVSLFSQYFFEFFNNFNKNKKIFWDAKCFSIPENKINSYIKYRSQSIQGVMIVYFLKRKNMPIADTKLNEKINECAKFSDYKLLDKIQNGMLYFDGNKIDMLELLNSNNIKIIENIDIDNQVFTDLLDF